MHRREGRAPRWLLALCTAVGVAGGLGAGADRSAPAAVLAYDDASSPAYNTGWTTGTNGGTGFGPWRVLPGQNSNASGAFIGTSANNGDGGADQPPPTDIDVAGESWGLYANGGQAAEALRPLTGALDVGQHITLRFDNGWIDDGGRVGFSFNSATEDRLTVYFVGGEQNYTIFDQSGVPDTGIGFTDEGLAVDFELTGRDTYSLSLTPAGGSAVVFSGGLVGPGGSGIESVLIFNTNAGPFSQRDVFVNSLAVVPEPTAAIALLALGATTPRRLKRP